MHTHAHALQFRTILHPRLNGWQWMRPSSLVALRGARKPPSHMELTLVSDAAIVSATWLGCEAIGVEALPAALGSLGSLKLLDVRYCSSLPDKLPDLSAVRGLKVQAFPRSGDEPAG